MRGPGLRLEDLRVAERRVFIADGKGGRQRLIPVSARCFTAVAAYLDPERPAHVGTDRVLVGLKVQRRGQPPSAKGIDEILNAARRRTGPGQGVDDDGTTGDDGENDD